MYGHAQARHGISRPSRLGSKNTASATHRSAFIAPTGTIGLVMDCDTTGVEPDFALVKFKKLAGGGYFKIINRAVPEALRVARLLIRADIGDIEVYAIGHGNLNQAPAHQSRRSLKRQGLLRGDHRHTINARRCRPRSTSSLPSINGRSAKPRMSATNSA